LSRQRPGVVVQVLFVHTCRSLGQSVEATHATQAPVSESHNGVAGVAEQSLSSRQPIRMTPTLASGGPGMQAPVGSQKYPSGQLRVELQAVSDTLGEQAVENRSTDAANVLETRQDRVRRLPAGFCVSIETTLPIDDAL
jgi:hypothetical protein